MLFRSSSPQPCLETYRDSYVPIITKQGWGELISRMKARLDELKRQ